MKKYSFKIQFGDTDPAGIVFYPNYYRWMDAATHHTFEEIGYPTVSLMAENLAMPLLEANCVFKSPGYYHHTVTVHTDIEYVKSKVFKLRHAFYDGETLLAEGYEVRAWVEVCDGKLKTIPIFNRLRQELEKLIPINVL